MKRRRVLVAVPAEMQSVALAGDAFAGAKEILVRIEPKEAEKANGEAKSGGSRWCGKRAKSWWRGEGKRCSRI